LEIQTSAARSQIDRLEDALRKARQQEQMDRIRHVGSTVHTQDPTSGGMRGDDSTGIRRSGQFQSDMGQRGVEGQGEWEKERERDTWVAPPSPSVVASLTASAKASAEELQSTKVVLQQTTDELETVRALLKEMETSNASDIKDMLQESAKQARDHESTVATLQASIQAYQSEVRRLGSPEKGPKSSEEEQREALEALKDAEEQILLVEKRYQAKCSEMETLMR
jgi:vacuolar-type H+-ATPase subunit I/STV1